MIGSLLQLLPFLLGRQAQAHLAAAQEGGHHPRVPRSSLFALRVPEAVIEGRAPTSRAIERALDTWYAANDAYRALIDVPAEGVLIDPRDRSG